MANEPRREAADDVAAAYTVCRKARGKTTRTHGDHRPRTEQGRTGIVGSATASHESPHAEELETGVVMGLFGQMTSVRGNSGGGYRAPAACDATAMAKAKRRLGAGAPVGSLCSERTAGTGPASAFQSVLQPSLAR
jgi:hypothetical protein